MYKFVDISGFGHSGKGVITDLLNEFYGYQVPHYNFEFDLLRIQGGLLDLCTALHDDWSPIRSDAAIRRFRKVVLRLGTSAKLTRPYSMFIANGMNYEYYFNENFFRLSDQYVKSLISYIYEGYWPYPIDDKASIVQFYQRVVANIFGKKQFNQAVYMAAPDNFLELTQKYFNDLFTCIANKDTRVFVMHNAIEPFNPTRGLNLFEDARIIIVQRDPRDIYASIFVKSDVFIPKYEKKHFWKMKGSFLNTDNIQNFIERQKLQFSKIKSTVDDHRILRLRFEDIVLKYEETIANILNFLGETPSIHVRKKKFFDPEKSIKNIGIWKQMKGKDENAIRLINEELAYLCYDD